MEGREGPDPVEIHEGFSQREESFILASDNELPTWVEPRGQLGKWGGGEGYERQLLRSFPGREKKERSLGKRRIISGHSVKAPLG